MGDGPNPILASGGVPITIPPPAEIRSESSVTGSDNWAVVAGGFLAAAALALLFRGRGRARVREEVEARPRLWEVPIGRLAGLVPERIPVRPALPGGVNPFTALRTAGATAATATAMAGCGGGEEPDSVTPMPDPGPQPEDPPGTIYECIPPENSFLLLFRGYGVQYPVRVRDAEGQPTSSLAPSDPRDGCFVMSVNRLGPLEGDPVSTGVPYWVEGKWSNFPVPFPNFDDPDFFNATALVQGRALGHVLNDLYRGYPGSDMRLEGSWGTVFGLAGLETLGANASLAWMLDMTIDPQSCEAQIEPWQAVQRLDGIETAQETENLLVLPFYRSEACPTAAAVGGESVQTVTLCDNSGGVPCNTLGMTTLQRLEVTLVSLPIGSNPEDVQDSLQDQEIVSGALATFEDEGPVVLSIGSPRPSIHFQLPRRPVE